MKTKTKKTKVPFSKLPAWKKRVVIAKDVIARIKARQYQVETGRYCTIDLFEGSMTPEIDVKSNIKKIKQCRVCALGGLLMSATSFVNKVKIGDIKSNSDFKTSDRVKEVFESLFSPEQLSLIEYAFEGRIDEGCSNYGAQTFSLPRTENPDVRTFYRSHHSDEQRLVSICENIIKNKGEFKP